MSNSLLDTSELSFNEFMKYIERMVTLQILSKNEDEHVTLSDSFIILCNTINDSEISQKEIKKLKLNKNETDFSVASSAINCLCGRIPFSEMFHMINIVNQITGRPLVRATSDLEKNMDFDNINDMEVAT